MYLDFSKKRSSQILMYYGTFDNFDLEEAMEKLRTEFLEVDETIEIFTMASILLKDSEEEPAININ